MRARARRSLTHRYLHTQDADESKSGAGAGAGGGAKATSVGGFAAELAAIPEFAELGTLFRSTATVPLTESELEYLVTCVRHIYPEYVVFQFNITNTVPDQLLENVYVGMQVSDPENWDDVAVIPAESCKCNESAVSYVCLKRTNPGHFASSTFNCSVRGGCSLRRHQHSLTSAWCCSCTSRRRTLTPTPASLSMM